MDQITRKKLQKEQNNIPKHMTQNQKIFLWCTVVYVIFYLLGSCQSTTPTRRPVEHRGRSSSWEYKLNSGNW